MAQLYILFEHAACYTLFKAMKAESLEDLLPIISESVGSFKTFNKYVEFVTFESYNSGVNALENINAISEGILHPSLQSFLENNVPKGKKKHPVTLGVSEPKLSAAISETLGIQCSFTGPVPEIMRGIRRYFMELTAGLVDSMASAKAQLGLGHSYSRAKVKFNPNKIDYMIIQAVHLVDQLDKNINTFTMRVREWYSFHFPELIKVVPETKPYIQCVNVIRNRKDITEETAEQLTEILGDEEKAQNILQLAQSSFGMDISEVDLQNVYTFVERILALTKRRAELVEYLRQKMLVVAPNLGALIGDIIGARLIAQAGSLVNLAKCPASTLQILGAEKALFRALKTKSATPKYGLIFHAKPISKAKKTDKGRIARSLANKCSMATRIDCFRDLPTQAFGNKFRAQIDDRLKFYESGELPPKNIDVMGEALIEAEAGDDATRKLLKKQKKREKKRRLEDSMNMSALSTDAELSFASVGSSMNTSIKEEDESGEPRKKKKKKKRDHDMEADETFNSSQEMADDLINEENFVPEKKKKKKKSQSGDSEEMVESEQVVQNGVETPSKKKKKKRSHSESFEEEIPENGEGLSEKKKKKRKSMEEVV